MSRSVPEWIGKTDDAMPPPHVRLRILRRHNHRCHWTGLEIRAGDNWTPDHIIALCNGGRNVESNLAPILRGKPHAEKTAQDVAIKAKTDRMAKKHFGLKPKRQGFRGWRKMNGEIVWKDTP